MRGVFLNIFVGKFWFHRIFSRLSSAKVNFALHSLLENLEFSILFCTFANKYRRYVVKTALAHGAWFPWEQGGGAIFEGKNNDMSSY